MARDDSRERSPVSRQTNSRSYRDRGDSLKRKARGVSQDAPPAKKQSYVKDETDTDSDEGEHTTARKPSRLPRKEHNYPSVNELKKRIRDVKRLLARVDLPADARIVQERALAGYEKDLAEETARRSRSEMIKKYHFVRFLERKSADKELKRLLRREKEISNSESSSKGADLERIAQQIHIARVNLNYTIYYPLTEKYISLFPNKKQKKASADSDEHGSDSEAGPDARSRSTDSTTGTGEQPPMWHVVEKSMEEGTLDLLREGKLRTGLDGEEDAAGASKTVSSKPAAADKKNGSSKDSKKTNLAESVANTKSRNKQNNKGDRRDKDRKRSNAREDVQMRDAYEDDESDGGFFEE